MWTPQSALCLPKDWFRCSRTPGEREAQDNAYNLARSNRDSLSSEQEQEELSGVLVQPPREAQHLLVSGGGHARPWPLCWPRTVLEAGKGPCWSGLLSWGRMVQGDQDLKGKGLHCREMLALWNAWVFLSVQMSQYPRVWNRQAQDGHPIFVD